MLAKARISVTYNKQCEIMKTVVVGMSGGVDSSVTAALLKKNGYNVIGLFMKNWEELDDSGFCSSAKDFEDVVYTCSKIGIPYRSINFVKEYKDQVFSDFLKEYQAGYTPNPDILCNREIKFKVFFEKAMELGADYLATGHYCRNENNRLLKGKDPAKDQSYFLNAINGEVLDRVLFPLGDLHKSEVRKIAHELELPTRDKKDSTGICFIGERHFGNFLQQYIALKPGPFQQLDGTVVGEHRGAAHYTIGQRRHLGLGGPGERWYVVAKDQQKNIVFVERGGSHPALFTDYLLVNDVSWITLEPEIFPYRCFAKIRYRQEDQECIVTREDPSTLKVTFKHAQRAVAPRQSVAFYQGDVCLGGGMIKSAGPSYYELNKQLNPN